MTKILMTSISSRSCVNIAVLITNVADVMKIAYQVRICLTIATVVQNYGMIVSVGVITAVVSTMFAVITAL